jgi:hypothetical protein
LSLRTLRLDVFDFLSAFPALLFKLNGRLR